MPTKYYYADVRRYIDEGTLDLSVSELLKKEEFNGDPVTTNTLYKVYYLIDVYETENANFTTWRKAYPLEGTIVSSINNGPAGFNLTFTSGEGAAFVNVGKFVTESVNGIGHTKIAFTRKGGATTGAVSYTPKFTIGWKSTAAPNLSNVQINWRNWPDNTTNDAPNINWSTAKKPPTFPKTAIKDCPQLSGISTSATDNAELTIKKYDISPTDNKTWYFIVHRKTRNYDEIWTCGLNGENCKGLITPDLLKDLSSKANIDKWNAQVASQYITYKSIVNPNTPYKDVPTPAPKGEYRYNPPPYDNKSRTSMGQKAEYEDNDKFKNLAIFSEKTRERGLIYQDVNGAKILNRDPEKLKATTDIISDSSNQWGFRFMYNPTTFSYSSSSNNSVDWTLGAKDPATLLVGNSNVTFELYLNRIPDLKYLRMSNPKVSQAQLYGRNLKDYEIDGILNRGTEYDIEFLYRVLNGDPLNKPLLFDKEYSGASADFGFTTATPCWLQLNKNLKYFGSVASLQVNHVMFDLNMIPMLSTVSITFVRYPALWTATGLGEGVKAENIRANIVSTEKAPG
jgi:hypothetical protein